MCIASGARRALARAAPQFRSATRTIVEHYAQSRNFGQGLVVIEGPQGAEAAGEPLAAEREPRSLRSKSPSIAAPPSQPKAAATRKTPKAKTPRKSLAPSGTVKWFNAAKGFGFVEPDGGGKDVFLHVSAFEHSGIGTPREGQRVSFDVERDQRGRLSATNLRAND